MTPKRVTHGGPVHIDLDDIVVEPVVQGMRNPVELVLRHLAENPNIDELLLAFPRLTIDDVKACLGYAHVLVEDEEGDLPMTIKMDASFDYDFAIHPGETLADELEIRAMTQKALAEAMDRPVQVVNEIVNGKEAITAETALQLEYVFDIPARFWMNLQIGYDLTVARLAGRSTPTGRND